MSAPVRSGREGGIVDILYLIDRVEEMFMSGGRVPFSSHVVIDEPECLDLIEQIRLALPQEVRLARRVVAERDRLLAEANEQAGRLREHAEEAARRVGEDRPVRLAEDRARVLMDQAEGEVQEVHRQADEYSYRVLSSLQSRLRQIEGVVEEALEAFHSERGPDADA
jgi:hypothetical protein